jgi:DUF4097 and DUF4098 domain-containing protein YvlB
MNRCGFAVTVALVAGTALASTPDATPPNVSMINGGVDVSADHPYGEISTINGAIHVEDRAVVGRVHTINGGMTLGTQASAQSLRTINGAISVRAGAHVAGTVSTINGRIALEPAAEVSGHLSNINGQIHLEAAHVGGGIETVSGNIDVGARSRVEGGIWVKKDCSSGFWAWLFAAHCEPSNVVVGPDAIVQGTLRFEHEVKLYVSNRARIGPVEGAKAIVYSGEHPPG